MKIVFVRHGDPDYANDTVTERGKLEAEALVERIEKLNAKDFYCSPLGRARDTAAPTLKKLGVTATVYDWLQEFPAYVIDEKCQEKRRPWDLLPDFWTNLNDLYDKDKWIKTDFMQSGNVEEEYIKVSNGIDKIIAKYGYKRDGNIYRVEKESRDTIVIFCHFAVECVMLSHILGVSPCILWQGFVALPSSVTTIVTEERIKGVASFRTMEFGDTSHLYAKGITPSFAARFCETFSCEDERH